MAEQAGTSGADAAAPAVQPRAGRPGSDASLPVDQLVRAVADRHDRGIVVLAGRPGGGKTTALRHLRAKLADVPVGVFEAHQGLEARVAAIESLVVFATVDPGVTFYPAEVLDTFHLRPWGMDDCLEYLAAVHRGAIRSVLGRLANDATVDLLGGSPQLLAAVMDAMAADPEAVTAREVIRRLAWGVIPPGDALDRLMLHGPALAPLDREQWRWWRHDGFRRVCAADWIASRLAAGAVPPQMSDVGRHGDAADEIAAAVRLRPAAGGHLRHVVAADRRAGEVAMAASVLVAADPAWRPADGRGLNLAGARLAHARWAGVSLVGGRLAGTDLTGADLTEADLSGVDATGADLSAAVLRAARLASAKLIRVSLRAADLSAVSAADAAVSEADLAGADLSNGDWARAVFDACDLTDVRATRADFSETLFDRVTWAGADFAGARFTSAKLRRQDFAGAEWAGARFADASLLGCHLEGPDLPRADFNGADLTGSLLTGSHMPGGDFRRALLRGAGLADIDWTGADLRGADLTGASFHLGSTRAGLVGSTVPMEGSMTGFYTDDYHDQSYKSPEEIRKACLVGANLLDATVQGTDFYLVDLRRAKYSPAQGEHFARTGAILR